MSYQSPISLLAADPFIETLKNETDELVMRAVTKAHVEVDRDELLKALQYDRDQYQKGYSDGVLAERNRPRWIPVTERLPEEAKEVLALDNNGDFCIAWVIEFVGSKGTYSEWACADGWSDTQLPITHWQPLPEPPKVVQG